MGNMHASKKIRLLEILDITSLNCNDAFTASQVVRERKHKVVPRVYNNNTKQDYYTVYSTVCYF